jgi:hypothetical protein
LDLQEFLTDREKATLRRLVRAEAVRLGYGSQYCDYGDGNRSNWPRRLKHLRRIAGKLYADREM